MGRVVEILVGVSALAGIATFLGFRGLARATVRNLKREAPDPPANDLERRTDDDDDSEFGR